VTSTAAAEPEPKHPGVALETATAPSARRGKVQPVAMFMLGKIRQSDQHDEGPMQNQRSLWKYGYKH
jgi:hypothetical protein